MGSSKFQQVANGAPAVPCGTAVRQHRLERDLGAVVSEPARARLARMRRSVGFAARAIEASDYRPGFRPSYPVMVTLTYRDVDGWQPDHMSQWAKRVRDWWPGQNMGVPFRYVWVAELQKRGAVHYHVVVWLPVGRKLPMSDVPLVEGQAPWWPHGATQVVAARAAVPYLMKYLSKGGPVVRLPFGARCNGCGGLQHAMRRAKRWLGYPAFVRARADTLDDWRRAPGGGWADPDGVIIPSEYVRVRVGTRWGCLQVVDYGRPFEVHGPWSRLREVAAV